MTSEDEYANNLAQQGVDRGFAKWAIKYLEQRGIDPQGVDIVGEYDSSLDRNEQMSTFAKKFPSSSNSETMAKEMGGSRYANVMDERAAQAQAEQIVSEQSDNWIHPKHETRNQPSREFDELVESTPSSNSSSSTQFDFLGHKVSVGKEAVSVREFTPQEKYAKEKEQQRSKAQERLRAQERFQNRQLQIRERQQQVELSRLSYLERQEQSKMNQLDRQYRQNIISDIKERAGRYGEVEGSNIRNLLSGTGRSERGATHSMLFESAGGTGSQMRSMIFGIPTTAQGNRGRKYKRVIQNGKIIREYYDSPAQPPSPQSNYGGGVTHSAPPSLLERLSASNNSNRFGFGTESNTSRYDFNYGSNISGLSLMGEGSRQRGKKEQRHGILGGLLFKQKFKMIK